MATTFYRIAAVLLVLFAAAHTAGFLTFVPGPPEGVAVRDAMRSVVFLFGSKPANYQAMYNGFGLTVSAYLLFSAVLSWQLGTLAQTFAPVIARISWSFFAVQVATLVLCAIYFSAPQIITAAIVAIVVGIATLLVQRSSP